MKQVPICRVWELWKNPIFLRYGCARLRPAALATWGLLTLLITGFVFQMTRTVSEARSELLTEDVERTPLIPLLVIQALILFILGTAQCSGGMTAERDEGVIDYQRLLPMTPAAKVVGYLFGLPIREYCMFALTLPFVFWGLWRGNVPLGTCLALYGVLASTTILYHLTGLLTGTIVKNRRWAFLTSIGLIFLLYTVVPQAAKFGLVFFKYLTIKPIIEESMRYLLPSEAGDAWETGRRLLSDAKFYNLDFSEAVFTYFSQACLIVSFFVMLCRRWKDAESHLLGKLWALGFYLWIQILLLGNALPLIDSGKLFPTQQVMRMSYFYRGRSWQPESWEALSMILAYGWISLSFLWILSSIITPKYGTQINGWRRAEKQGRSRLPLLSDESNSTGFVVVMAIIGGAGWFIFMHYIVESRWFPGHFAPLELAPYFLMTILTGALSHQLLLENKGDKLVFFAAVLVLVLPLMIAAVLVGASDHMIPAAVWIAGISPLAHTALCVANHLTITDLPMNVSRAIPGAYVFWQSAYLMFCVSLILKLYRARNERRQHT